MLPCSGSAEGQQEEEHAPALPMAENLNSGRVGPLEAAWSGARHVCVRFHSPDDVLGVGSRMDLSLGSDFSRVSYFSHGLYFVAWR